MIRDTDQILRDANRAARRAFVASLPAKLSTEEKFAIVQCEESGVADPVSIERLINEILPIADDLDLLEEGIRRWVEDDLIPIWWVMNRLIEQRGVGINEYQFDPQIEATVDRIAKREIRGLRHELRRILAEAADEGAKRKNERHPSLTDAERNPTLGKRLGMASHPGGKKP